MKILVVLICLIASGASARDLGQWESGDPGIREWYQALMQPDNPAASCCGEADAYWADAFEVDGDRYVAIITDPRPDADKVDELKRLGGYSFSRIARDFS